MSRSTTSESIHPRTIALHGHRGSVGVADGGPLFNDRADNGSGEGGSSRKERSLHVCGGLQDVVEFHRGKSAKCDVESLFFAGEKGEAKGVNKEDVSC